jgi:nucleoside-diphosphate-sugar epimerase
LGQFGKFGKLTDMIDYQPARKGDVRRHIANVIKAKDLLGFVHQTRMEDGVKETIKYYLGE